MPQSDELVEIKRIKAHKKRRCPYCQSDKWTWLHAEPTTPEELERYLLTRYRCDRCGKEFLVEEAKGSRYVPTADKCTFCGSAQLEKTSKPDADLGIWICKKCGGYMGVE